MTPYSIPLCTLDEMTGAVWAAVQVALLGRTVDLLPAGGARNIANSRSEGSEDRIEPLDDLGLATNHHAVTSDLLIWVKSG
jgi:hypothetical protein